MDSFLSALAGLRARIDDQIEQGDKVVTRWSITARHDGELFGAPPTGKEIVFTGIDIHRIENGRIVEEWDNWDALGLMRQLGVVAGTGE
jgi:predicted ester cyclase